MKIKFALLLAVINSALLAECSDLDQAECNNWPTYCTWDNENQICTEVGGGGGNLNYGPYEFSYLIRARWYQKWSLLR